MKPVYVLQQVPHETLGSFADAFRIAAIPCHYIPLFRSVPTSLDLDQAAALVVLGGPMNVDQMDRYPFLNAEVTWIEQALARRLPILGVCLGCQLLAKALGASVYPNRVKEIGWYEIELTDQAGQDRLLGGLDRSQTVFQWHGDTFDLPAGAVPLARSALCRSQAYRYGTTAYGLQFHAEVTGEMVDQWLNEPENRKELAGLPSIDPRAIRRQTSSALRAMRPFGEALGTRFSALCREQD